ncbi:hypothetical protein NA56DRAFT_664105 [Hyaloscypha hepaticicola]|uniref:Uncharacterized protein n=1 Tax=Hyaloscypha hepaticicola TaxID=2082293 RepID=A0A2J6PMG1_9HELO|nr:hypothetical protein NA56DRAFT_664105 [Hyaloscypha hepaticicola]
MALKRQHHAKELMILIAKTTTRKRIDGQRIKPAPERSSMIPEVDVEALRMTILRVAEDLDLEGDGEPGGDVDVAGCEVGVGDWVGVADLLACIVPDPDGCHFVGDVKGPVFLLTEGQLNAGESTGRGGESAIVDRWDTDGLRCGNEVGDWRGCRGRDKTKNKKTEKGE